MVPVRISEQRILYLGKEGERCVNVCVRVQVCASMWRTGVGGGWRGGGGGGRRAWEMISRMGQPLDLDKYALWSPLYSQQNGTKLLKTASPLSSHFQTSFPHSRVLPRHSSQDGSPANLTSPFGLFYPRHHQSLVTQILPSITWNITSRKLSDPH